MCKNRLTAVLRLVEPAPQTLLRKVYHCRAYVHAHIAARRRQNLRQEPFSESPRTAAKFENGRSVLEVALFNHRVKGEVLVERLPILPGAEPIIESACLLNAQRRLRPPRICQNGSTTGQQGSSSGEFLHGAIFRSDCEHRPARAADYVLGHAPEKQACNACSAVSGHDN